MQTYVGGARGASRCAPLRAPAASTALRCALSCSGARCSTAWAARRRVRHLRHIHGRQRQRKRSNAAWMCAARLRSLHCSHASSSARG